MQTEQSQPKFKIHPGVFVVIAIVLVALALPLALVALAFRPAEPPPRDLPEPKELRTSLETIAEKSLLNTPLSTSGFEVEIEVQDPSTTAQRLERFASTQGGVALTSADPEHGLRVMMNLPGGGNARLTQELSLIVGEAQPAIPEGQLVQVHLNKQN